MPGTELSVPSASFDHLAFSWLTSCLPVSILPDSFGADRELTGYHSRIIFLEIKMFAPVFKSLILSPVSASLDVLSVLSLKEH